MKYRRAINKLAACRVMELKGQMTGCGNTIHVLDVARNGHETVTLVNIYDQRPQGGENRLAQETDWGAIVNQPRVMIASDVNAQSKLWNLRVPKRRNAPFWEELVEEHVLVI